MIPLLLLLVPSPVVVMVEVCVTRAEIQSVAASVCVLRLACQAATDTTDSVCCKIVSASSLCLNAQMVPHLATVTTTCCKRRRALIVASPDLSSHVCHALNRAQQKSGWFSTET